MKKIPSLVLAPNPVLYRRAQAIKVFDSNLQQLVDEMLLVMRQASGMGLAAPQIGKSVRVAIVEFKPKEKDKTDHPTVPLTVLVNPKIIHHSRQVTVTEEGCLSLPKINLEIERFAEIELIYQDIEGRRQRMRAQDLVSRMIQHEVDHLNGILITDRHVDEKKVEELVRDKA